MLTTAVRIAAAERAICQHTCDVDPGGGRLCSGQNGAIDLLRSLALWAEVNGFCLRVPKPEFVDTEE